MPNCIGAHLHLQNLHAIHVCLIHTSGHSSSSVLVTCVSKSERLLDVECPTLELYKLMFQLVVLVLNRKAFTEKMFSSDKLLRCMYIADSVQTEYCPTFPLSVCLCVTGVTSHISHIYKGIIAMLIIRDPSTPIYSESKSSWLSF